MSQPALSDQDPQPLPTGVVEELLRYQGRMARAERLLETVNEAARAVRIPFTTYLLMGTYIGIIIASTTDEQLLRVSPVTLPLLNVELPILSFYLFAPWLFLLIHFNLLLYFALLERQLRLFERYVTELQEADAVILRKRLYNFPFVHMLIGQQYDLFMRLVLVLIVWITVIALPLWLLLWAQIAFLTFHDPDITWGQRAAVVLDAAILVLFWSRIVSSKSALAWWVQRWRLAWAWLAWLLAFPWAMIRRALRRPWIAPQRLWVESRGEQVEGSGAGFLLLTALAAVLTSLLIATVPDEAWERELLARLPQGWIYQDEVTGRRFFRPTYVLFEAKGAFFARNLELREQVLTVNDLPTEVINILREGQAGGREQVLRKVLGINLQGRDLRYARLSMSVLPKADLRGAGLQAADLRNAQLQGTNLAGASLQGANLAGARLQDADLSWADLAGANLAGAGLQGADLNGTRLQSANLRQAELQGAKLQGAKLRGANLDHARLQDADLRQAQLQDASLIDAWVKGADLRWAELQGADLRFARLQGANLRQAELQGANLHWAKLQGANLGQARLQGADLREVQMQGADLHWAELQGADLRFARLQGADLREVQLGGARFTQAHLDLADLRGIDRTAPTQAQHHVLRKVLELKVDDAGLRERILKRFQEAMGQAVGLDEVNMAQPCLSDGPKPLPGCVTEEQLATHRAALTSHLVMLACSDPYVARGVAQRVLSISDGEIGSALLDANCLPVVELPVDTRDQLGKIPGLPASRP